MSRIRLCVLCMLALAAVVSGCSTGSSGDTSLTPAIVQRYVLTQEASDNLTRVISSISTADQDAQSLAGMKPGTTRWQNMLFGTRLSWNNVEVVVNNFTPAQYAALPAVRTMAGKQHAAAIAWLETLDRLRANPPATRQEMLHALGGAQKTELRARASLKSAALGLTTAACALTMAHRQLAAAQTTVAECGSAGQLSTGG